MGEISSPPELLRGCTWLQRPPRPASLFPWPLPLPLSGTRNVMRTQNVGFHNAFSLTKLFCLISLPEVREQYRCSAERRHQSCGSDTVTQQKRIRKSCSSSREHVRRGPEELVSGVVTERRPARRAKSRICLSSLTVVKEGGLATRRLERGLLQGCAGAASHRSCFSQV